MLGVQSTQSIAQDVRERSCARKRENYRKNLHVEREKGRLRAQRRKQAGYTAEESLRRKELHRQAQARYREANRTKLRHDSLEYSCRLQHKKLRQREEEEFQAFMALEFGADRA